MLFAMTRLPALLSFLLFLALAVTLAYWIPQWTAPAPRAVSSPVKTEQAQTPVSAAANLFGGGSEGTAMANVQLRGVVHSGRASDSVAIIAVEGKPPRALRVNSEIAPGLKIKQILNKTVVVLDQGAERELSLPSFSAQESAVTAQPVTSSSTITPQANAPAVVSPGPSSSGGQGINSPGAANTQDVMTQGSGTPGSGAALPPERLRMPAQGLPTAPAGAGGVPPSP
jgi:general secretion pathway protein C